MGNTSSTSLNTIQQSSLRISVSYIVTLWEGCLWEREKHRGRRGRLTEKIRREARYQRAETEKGKAEEETKRQEKETERQRYRDVLVAQSCLTLCDLMDCSPPGSTVHGILQARILEWVTIPSSSRSSQSIDQTQVSSITGGFFAAEPPGKVKQKQWETEAERQIVMERHADQKTQRGREKEESKRAKPH